MSISAKEYYDLYNFVEDFIDNEYRYNEEFQSFFDTPCERYWDCYEPTSENVYLNNGATKGVMIFDNLDYVLKFPFMKEEIERWDKNSHIFVTQVKDTINYCEIESEVYDDAVREGIEDMFAETFLLGYFHDFPVYAQKRVECDEDSLTDSFSNHCYEEWCSENGYDSDDETARDEYNDVSYDYEDASEVYVCMRDYYSAEEFVRFCNFIDDNYINDLHVGNFGFFKGRLVVIDFSGYGGGAAHRHDDDEE